MAPRGDIVAYRSSHERQDRTSRLGMIIFLGSWAMLFASLFFAYGLIRGRAQSWPPGDLPHLPILLPGLSTLAIIASSAALQLGIGAVRARRDRWLTALIGLTFLLGALFAVLQVRLWTGLYLAGLRPTAGPYASVFWGLTCVHAAHVGVGLLALLWLSYRASRGAYNAARFVPVRLWAMYWHFVGVVWLVLYVSVFLL